MRAGILSQQVQRRLTKIPLSGKKTDMRQAGNPGSEPQVETDDESILFTVQIGGSKHTEIIQSGDSVNIISTDIGVVPTCKNTQIGKR